MIFHELLLKFRICARALTTRGWEGPSFLLGFGNLYKFSFSLMIFLKLKFILPKKFKIIQHKVKKELSFFLSDGLHPPPPPRQFLVIFLLGFFMSKNYLKRADQEGRAPQTKKAKNDQFCISIKKTTTTAVECYFWNCSIYYLLCFNIFFMWICLKLVLYARERGRG